MLECLRVARRKLTGVVAEVVKLGCVKPTTGSAFESGRSLESEETIPA
jgi:hypothetical protein